MSHKLISCPNSTKFQPEGEKMIVSSFSDPIRLICPPEVGAAFQSSATLITPAALKKYYTVHNKEKTDTLYIPKHDH